MKTLCLVTFILGAACMVHAQDAQTSDTADAAAEAASGASEPAMAAASAPAAARDTLKEGAEEFEGHPNRYPNKKYIDAVLERSSHPSLGYALGRQGDGFVLGVRFDQPVTKTNWGYLQAFHYTNFGPFIKPLDPVLMFGINFVTRTKLIMGMFRLYGGGGFHVGYRPSPACKNPFDSSDIARAYVDEGQPPSINAPNIDPDKPNPALVAVANRIADVQEKCKQQKDPFGISGGGTGGIELFSSPVRGYFIELSGGGGTQKSGLWSDSGLILRAGNQFYF